ncbi:hypothetical protein UlMin_011252 [Ulmus minor]
MIVSDIDHTMVHHHDAEDLSLLRFNALWESNYRHDSLLVFSTGRSPTLYKELRKEKPMLTPYITIMSVGTKITCGNSMVPDEGWVQYLNQKWDKNIVIEEASKFSELTLQVETEIWPHKVSFYVKKDKAQAVTKVLSKSIAKNYAVYMLLLNCCFNFGQLDVKIIYNGGMDLDILPQGASKGQALAYLLKKFKIEGTLPVNTLVCGDSGNNAELFSILDVHGIMKHRCLCKLLSVHFSSIFVVSNAQEELLHWYAENAKNNPKIIHTTERCAAGIIQAIGHFHLGPNISPRDVADFSKCNLENVNSGHEMVKFNLFYEKWRPGEIDYNMVYIANLKANCHPSGVFVHPLMLNILFLTLFSYNCFLLCLIKSKIAVTLHDLGTWLKEIAFKRPP